MAPKCGPVVDPRHRRHRVGLLMLLPATLAVATAAGAYASGGGPGAAWAAWLTLLAWIPGIVALPLLLGLREQDLSGADPGRRQDDHDVVGRTTTTPSAG